MIALGAIDLGSIPSTLINKLNFFSDKKFK
jgi:hypothetical protein